MSFLQEIRLINFRNHTDFSLQLSPVTVITGSNGVGKTSIVEAISYLSVASSWKTDKDSEVILWDAEFARVTGKTDVEHELVLQRHPTLKRIKIDGVAKRLQDVLGVLPTVIFQPDDSAILYGAPSYRRQLLDRLLCQTEPGYTLAIQQYQKVLKQRNKLLKRIQDGLASSGELEYWDGELAGAAELIQKSRAKLIEFLHAELPAKFAELMPGASDVGLEYVKSPGQGELLVKLQNSRDKEIAAGSTLYGPHREDLQISYAKVTAAESMSRGQGRAVVVALKLLEVVYSEMQTGSKPILLLDDIFSEFDEVRQRQLIELLPRYQTVMTTTHSDSLKGVVKEFSEVRL